MSRSGWVRGHADGAHESVKADIDTSQIRRGGALTAQFPANDEWIGENVAQKTEAGDDDRVAERVGRNIEQRDCEYVTGLRVLHVERPRQWMHEIQIQRNDIGGRRVAVQRVIERIARPENHNIAGLRGRHGRDGRVPAIVAFRIVDTALAGLRDDDRPVPFCAYAPATAPSAVSAVSAATAKDIARANLQKIESACSPPSISKQRARAHPS